MSEIRQFTRADVGAVAALFQKTFRDADTPPGASLESYLAEAYLEHPWFDPEIASRVNVADDGRVTGFVGVFPGRFRYGDATLRAAIAGTLMVENREREPLAGAKLLRSVIKGPQDISISETTNLLSQALWEPLGGRVVPLLSLDWFRAFRPIEAALSVFAERHSRTRLLAPVARLGDLIGRPWTGRHLAAPDPDRRLMVDTAPTDAGFAEAILALSEPIAFRPDWSTGDIVWLLAHAARKERYGPLHHAIVHDAKGGLAGCYLYHGRPGGTGRVLQVLAKAKSAAGVVDCLFSDAEKKGLAGLRGRVGSSIVQTLLTRNCVFLHRASTVVYSARAEIMTAIAGGEALVTGLAGESWTRLVGDTFS